jgi:alkylation response protein AidB-like acyl-CoA dehydrogenase
VDFRLGPKSDAFRAEVQAFLAAHVTAETVERAHRTGTYHDWDLHRALAAKGWLAASWPLEDGGQGRDPLEMTALTEEMALCGAPTDGMSTTIMIATLLRHVATDALKKEVLPRVLAGEVLMCLGYSEPDAGSDVAAASSRAVRDGDAWVINGQKMWTSLAHESAYVILLTRTNTQVPKQRGLTLFLVPLDARGVEIRAVETLGGQRTNMTFYTDVHVDDHYRVGNVDDGWNVMRTALSLERGGKGRGMADRMLQQAIDWAGQDEHGDRPLDRAIVREQLARVAVRNEVATLLGYRAAWLSATGQLPGVAGSMGKLYSSESYVRSAADLLDLAGSAGVLEHGAPDAPAAGWLEYAHRKAQVTTIYQGTSEIQRSIIAEQGLGLPRSR